MSIAEADKIAHAVEDQWHYEIMVKHGYVAETKVGVGFSRSYRYTHPVTGRSITVTTGISADYWKDNKTGKIGYWSELEPHLQKVTT